MGKASRQAWVSSLRISHFSRPPLEGQGDPPWFMFLSFSFSLFLSRCGKRLRHLNIKTCTCTDMHVWMDAYMQQMRTYINAHTHTHGRTHMHTHVHTHAPARTSYTFTITLSTLFRNQFIYICFCVSLVWRVQVCELTGTCTRAFR